MESKRKILTAIGIFIGIAAVFIVVVLYPIFQGILKDHRAVLQQKQELLQINESKKRSHEFEAISQDYAEEFLQLQDLFVDMETPISFFRFLDDTASSFGLQMEKSPGNVQEGEGDAWPSFVIRLVGEGLYSNVLLFLEKIENAPYLMQIQALTITEAAQSGEGPPNGQVEFSLSLKVFVQ